MTNDDERYLRQIGYGDICDRVRQYERDIRRIDDEKIAVLREQIKGLQKRVAVLEKALIGLCNATNQRSIAYDEAMEALDSDSTGIISDSEGR